MIIKQVSPNSIAFTGMKRAWENIKTGLIKKGHKVIKKGNNYDIAFANAYDPLSLIRLLRAKKPKVIHAATTNTDIKGTYSILDLTYRYIIKYLAFFYSKADRIITISNFAKRCLQKEGLKSKIEVISCGVDLNKFKYSTKKRASFRKEHGVSKDELLILNVGMLTWRKGIDRFIALGRAFPQAKFLWAGPKLLFKKNWFKIRKLIKNKASNVIFAGYVNDIVSAYCGADIFLFTTRSENEGLPILEAGACKRPIISTNLPPIAEKIKNGKNGFLCNNQKDFFRKLKQLIRSKQLRKQMGAESYKMAKKYDVSKTTAKIIKILEECK